MKSEYKYDVFISYSRKDYVDENKNVIPGNPISKIKKAFDDNDITYWFDEEGIYSGQAFVDVITEAIAQSKSFVFVSSDYSNQSKWTKSEILEAFDSDRTIIPFKIDDTEYHKSLKFFLRPLDFISYFESKEDAINELVRSVNNVKTTIMKRQDEAKIIELIDDYRRIASQEEMTLAEIIKLHLSVGRTEKQCPVCEKKNKIGDKFCRRCGWQFHPLYAIDSDSDIANKDHLTLFKANWGSIGKTEDLRKEKKSLEEENKQLKSKIETTEDELHAKIAKKEQQLEWQLASQSKIYEERISKLEEEKRSLEVQMEISQHDLTDRLNHLQGDWMHKNYLYVKLQEEYAAAQQKIKELEEDIIKLTTNVTFDVVLLSAGMQKLAVVKTVKEITGLGLKEAKDFVDLTPNIIIEGVSEEKATTFKEILEEVGATVVIKPHETSNQSNTVKSSESFNSKQDVFNFIRSYSYLPNSLKSSDELKRITDLSRLQNDLLDQYGIELHIGNPKRYTIGDLVTMIWNIAKTKRTGTRI